MHDDSLLTSLVLVIRLLGRDCTAQQLVSGLPLLDQRLTPLLLPRAAARAQCSTQIVRRRLGHWSQGVLPAILFLSNQRTCVLLSETDSHYLVHYPEAPEPVEIQKSQLQDEYAGLAVFVQPRYQAEARTADARLPARSGHWFWAAMLGNWKLYRDALVAALLINIFALVTPLYVMNVYDRVLPNNATETLWALTIGIALAVVFNLILTAVRSYVVDVASKRIDVELSTRIMEQVLDLKMENRPRSVGSFASNLRSFESVRDFIASASLTTLVDLPFVILFLAVMMWISPWLALPPIVAIVLVLIVSFISLLRIERMTLETFQANAQRNAGLIESLNGMETVKALNAQSYSQQKWEESTKYLAEIGAQIKVTSSATLNFVNTCQQLVNIAVIVAGVYLFQTIGLSMGAIIAASLISRRCLAPLGQVVGLMMQYHRAKASLKSIDGYMNMPVERPTGKSFMPRPFLKGDIEFKNVGFAYPGASQDALAGISFRIKPGERVGIIGRIGSGKSTLEKLILKLYEPTQGTILMDGIDLAQIDPADVRRVVGYVSQDPVLFYGSLRHNLTISSPFATDEDVLRAAMLAGVDEFAATHPEGYGMVVGERGDSLSGGQRQSIAIARALVNDPQILLLDEPSSNMDHQSESQLKARLRAACEGKTMILVTHRTSLLDLVDRLMVIDHGKIVADGPKAQIVESLREGRIGRARRSA
ncbi:type I secretion system permease/ATPase [Castellaniella sp.]|uniref:type I secretion system permease/ATPase n=1 Tax=Castellaniella sp. TaxID=1955812 RepID=UPI002AFF0873|nr:type I secretion system permease/ATPase [Castellaniella sp.]